MNAPKQLAFIADDFGLNAEINAAIVRAHRDGALTGASLMMGQPGTDEAIALAHRNPTLEIGWHLHLCDSRPLTFREWPWGRSPVRAGFLLALMAAHRQRVHEEIVAQWRRFGHTGLTCRFINTHHHLHLHPWVSRELRRIVGDVGSAWFRGGRFRSFGSGEPILAAVTRGVGNLRAATLAGPEFFRCADSVWGLDRLRRMNAQETEAIAAVLPPGLHEFMYHPSSQAGDADLAALLALRFRRARVTNDPISSP